MNVGFINDLPDSRQRTIDRYPVNMKERQALFQAC